MLKIPVSSMFWKITPQKVISKEVLVRLGVEEFSLLIRREMSIRDLRAGVISRGAQGAELPLLKF